ncbi:MAG: uL15m family ribosomal protein [Candidatus Micrarchaeota archaeon]
MTRRHKKSTRKLLGDRTFGRGSSKHGRGRGSRMGRGSVKRGQRNKMHIYKYERERLAKKGFNSLRKKQKGINLYQIMKLTDKNEIDMAEYGYGKVLSSGEITKPMKITAKAFSKTAKEKIEKAGGQAIVPGEKVES